MSDPSPDPVAYQEAIFDRNGPLNPFAMEEAVRTLFRALPLDVPGEPNTWAKRRMYTALLALASLNPRDTIEIMLGVQAICAYHAAAANWHLGMNTQVPRGANVRHFAAAASATRTFDSMLRAIERRQAKPLAAPAGRPPSRPWSMIDPDQIVANWETRCAGDTAKASPPAVWSKEAIAETEALLQQERTARENEGLDIANTKGILPGGGMIVPEHPDPNQTAYLARREVLMLKRQYRENQRKGIKALPQIPHIRPGDLLP